MRRRILWNLNIEDEKGDGRESTEGIEQIDEKKYDTKLKARGIKNILKIGVAFYGKK